MKAQKENARRYIRGGRAYAYENNKYVPTEYFFELGLDKKHNLLELSLVKAGDSLENLKKKIK